MRTPSGTTSRQFLRNPGEVGEILRQKIAARTQDRTPEFDRRSLEIALETKAEERARVLGLFRKGRIDEAALDSQLDEIVAEEESLQDAPRRCAQPRT